MMMIKIIAEIDDVTKHGAHNKININIDLLIILFH